MNRDAVDFWQAMHYGQDREMPNLIFEVYSEAYVGMSTQLSSVT